MHKYNCYKYIIYAINITWYLDFKWCKISRKFPVTEKDPVWLIKKKKQKKMSGHEVKSKINSQIYFKSLCDIIITTFSKGPVLKIAETSKRWDIYVHAVCREHSLDNSRWLTDFNLMWTAWGADESHSVLELTCRKLKPFQHRLGHRGYTFLLSIWEHEVILDPYCTRCTGKNITALT